MITISNAKLKTASDGIINMLSVVNNYEMTQKLDLLPTISTNSLCCNKLIQDKDTTYIIRFLLQICQVYFSDFTKPVSTDTFCCIGTRILKKKTVSILKSATTMDIIQSLVSIKRTSFRSYNSPKSRRKCLIACSNTDSK